MSADRSRGGPVATGVFWWVAVMVVAAAVLVVGMASRLASAPRVQSAVLAAMNAQGWQIPDDGVQPDQGLGSSLTPADHAYGHLLLLGPAKRGYFSTPSTMPGALVEPLFITDPFEGSIAASNRGQQVIAAGLASAVEQYFAPGSAP